MIGVCMQIVTKCSHFDLLPKARSLLFVTILLIQSTCITRLDVEPSDFEAFLVVQGFINDDFGPHDIRISRISTFAGTREGGSFRRIEGAEVRIMDQNGEVTVLESTKVIEKRKQTPCGIVRIEVTTDYLTPETFKAEIGSFYVLEIKTTENKIYRSIPQTVLPTPPIDSIFLDFKVLPSLDPVVPASGVEVSASWTDPVEEENFYFWRINGIYRIHTPDRSFEGFCCPYDPLDGGSTICWIVEKNVLGNKLAFSDQRVNGQSITFPVGLIKDDGLRFGDRILSPDDKLYHVEVEQYGIPKEAFEFNEKVATLGEINGEIFDPPPLSVRGNIFNITDPEEVVIGYFGAYSVQRAGKFLNRSQLGFTQFFTQQCGDCRIRQGAQTETPEPFR